MVHINLGWIYHICRLTFRIDGLHSESLTAFDDSVVPFLSVSTTRKMSYPLPRVRCGASRQSLINISNYPVIRFEV